MRALDHNLNHVHDCLFSSVPCRLILHNKYNSWYEIAWHDIHMCGPGWWSRFTSGQFVCVYTHNYVVICYCIMLYRLHEPADATCLCICSLESFSWMSPHPFSPHNLRWQFHWQRGTTQYVSGWRGNTSTGTTPSAHDDLAARRSWTLNSVCQRLYDYCSEIYSAGVACL